MSTRFFVIEESQLNALEAVKKRLFTENRMNGDEMRDAAQIIDAFIRVTRSFEMPPEDVPATSGDPKRERCPECRKVLPNEEETEQHDHAPQCAGCKVFCWRVVNGDECVEGSRDAHPGDPNELVHRAAASVLFHAICGSDESNQKTTQISKQVTCPTCLTMQEGDTR